MEANNIIYSFHVATVLSLLLSGIFIMSVRGTKPPILYMLHDRFVLCFLAVVNLFQASHTPMYGQALWNPIHLLMILSVYPFLFAYIFGMARPGSMGFRYWLTAFVPVIVLATLYFGSEVHFGRLHLFSRYADLRNYLHLPQLWILFAAAGFSIAMISLYTVRAIGMLRNHKRNLEFDFSCKEGNTLGWMWWAIGLTLAKWLILLLRIMVEGQIHTFIGLFIIITEPIIIAVLVVRQKDLYSQPVPKDKDCTDLDFIADDITGGLSPGKRQNLKQAFLHLLENDEIYKNPDLTCEKVCAMMSTNRTYLSLIINQDMNTTFYRLINDYRLRKADAMIRDPQHRNMSLTSISEISGFKNLSTFSRLFKQAYGTMPKDRRKETLQGDDNRE